jgi:hypothetical protein
VDVAPVSYSYRLRRADPVSQRPRVLVVTPFAVYPPRHGGGRRVAELLARLRVDYDVILVSDEAALHDARSFAHFDGLYAVHLIQRRERNGDAASPALETRMRAHLHAPLRALVRSALQRYEPDIVQIEHVELAELVELRSARQRWVLGLHDAYGAADFVDPASARRFGDVTLPRYDAITVCSDEDAALVAHRRVAVILNGSSVAPDDYAPSAGSELLFVGPFRYAPNLAGIRTFLAEAFPRIRAPSSPPSTTRASIERPSASRVTTVAPGRIAAPSSSSVQLAAALSEDTPQVGRELPCFWLAAFEQKAKPHRGEITAAASRRKR